jgi:hypothetical protein
MVEPWEQLLVGDCIRIVRVPACVWAMPLRTRDGPEGTLRIYQKLIDKRVLLRVCEIDGQGIPWIRYTFRNKQQQWEYHWLAVNDDSWERVS